jgi:hypothetical protein
MCTSYSSKGVAILCYSWACLSFEVVAHKVFVDNLDIFYKFVEMGNDEGTEMQLKFHDFPNPSVFVTTPKVGETGLNLTAANDAVITQKFWVINEQRQAFAQVIRLGQNRVPHTWLLNTTMRLIEYGDFVLSDGEDE